MRLGVHPKTRRHHPPHTCHLPLTGVVQKLARAQLLQPPSAAGRSGSSPAPAADTYGVYRGRSGLDRAGACRITGSNGLLAHSAAAAPRRSPSIANEPASSRPIWLQIAIIYANSSHVSAAIMDVRRSVVAAIDFAIKTSVLSIVCPLS